MQHFNKQLFQENLITKKQYTFLESIRTEKVISLYHELRLILYLGILLFTSGLGYIAYQNLGDVGHFLAMTLILTALFFCFRYIRKHSVPYSNDAVNIDIPFFDYLLLLSGLLIISLFAYVQIYFELVEQLLNISSLLSSAILLFLAYRYDNRALLAIGITAFVAWMGINISPVSWKHGISFNNNILYGSGILLGLVLFIIGELSNRMNLKKHFQFTYQNFGILLYFTGCISALFDSSYSSLYAILTLISGLLLSYRSRNKKEFLFFLYASISTYIAFSYLIVQLIGEIDMSWILLLYYFPLSTLLYVVFLIKNKSHFSHD